MTSISGLIGHFRGGFEYITEFNRFRCNGSSSTTWELIQLLAAKKMIIICQFAVFDSEISELSPVDQFTVTKLPEQHQKKHDNCFQFNDISAYEQIFPHLLNNVKTFNDESENSNSSQQEMIDAPQEQCLLDSVMTENSDTESSFSEDSNCNLFADAPESWINVLGQPKHSRKLKLMSLAYASKETLIRASMYPEVTLIDTTSNTNILGLHLLYICGCDGEGKTDVWISCFLTRQCQSQFRWLLCVALQFLFSKTILSQICCIVTDGDEVLGREITKAINENVIGNDLTKHILCYWHTVSLYLDKTVSSKVDKDIVALIKRWIFRMARVCLTGNELNNQWDKLERFLQHMCNNEKSVTVGQLFLIRETIQVIRSKQTRFCVAFNKKLQNFDTWTTARVEGENSALKCNSRIHNRAHPAQTAICDITKLRHRNIKLLI